MRVSDVKDSGFGGGEESSEVIGIDDGGDRSLNNVYMTDVVAIVVILLFITQLCSKFQVDRLYDCLDKNTSLFENYYSSLIKFNMCTMLEV